MPVSIWVNVPVPVPTNSLCNRALCPPTVAPSCILNVLRSVSTVTSPWAPVNEACWVVLPLLNFTSVLILFPYATVCPTSL